MSYKSFSNTNYFSGTFLSTHEDPLSIVLWVKRSAADWNAAGGDCAIAIGDDSTDINSSFAVMFGTSDTVIARTTNSSATSTDAVYSFTDGLYDDVWFPCVAILESDTSQWVYVENWGNQLNYSAETITNVLDTIIVGNNTALNDAYDNGSVAEIAIFNKVLSPFEINKLQYRKGCGIPPNLISPRSCIGYWPLRDSKSIHPDESGNRGPSLTMNGTVTWSTDHPKIAVQEKRRVTSIFKSKDEKFLARRKVTAGTTYTTEPTTSVEVNTNHKYAQGLVSIWRFIDGFKDDMNNYNMTIQTGSPSVANSLCTAVKSNSDGLNAGNAHERILTSGEYTFLAYCKPDLNDSIILSAYQQASNLQDWNFWFNTSSPPAFRCHNGSGDLTHTTTTTYTLGQWHKIIISFSASLFYGHINGVTEWNYDPSSTVGWPGSPTEDCLVLVDADSTGNGSLGNYFDGDIDYIFLWDKQYSLAEGLEIYANPWQIYSNVSSTSKQFFVFEEDLPDLATFDIDLDKQP